MADVEKINKLIIDVGKNLEKLREKLREVAGNYAQTVRGSEEYLKLANEATMLQRQIRRRLAWQNRLEEENQRIRQDRLNQERLQYHNEQRELEENKKQNKKDNEDAERRRKEEEKQHKKELEEKEKAYKEDIANKKKALKNFLDTYKEAAKVFYENVADTSYKKKVNGIFKDLESSANKAIDNIVANGGIWGSKWQENLQKRLLSRLSSMLTSSDIGVDRIKLKSQQSSKEQEQTQANKWFTAIYDSKFNGNSSTQNATTGGSGETNREQNNNEDSKNEDTDELKTYRKKLESSYKNLIAAQEHISQTFGNISTSLVDLDKSVNDMSKSINTATKVFGKLTNTAHVARSGLLGIMRMIRSSKLYGNISRLSDSMSNASRRIDSIGTSVSTTPGGPNNQLGNVGPTIQAPSRRSHSSFKTQETKNQRRQEQKGFIALLIPALAKLLKKSSIWDAIKLLLLKFGANHPLITSAALMAGPALMAGGVGLKMMGGLKGVGKLGTTAVEKATNLGVAARKYGGIRAASKKADLDDIIALRKDRFAKYKSLNKDYKSIRKVQADLNIKSQDLQKEIMRVQTGSAHAKYKYNGKTLGSRQYMNVLRGKEQNLRNTSQNVLNRRISLEDELVKTKKSMNALRKSFKNTQKSYEGIVKSNKTFIGQAKNFWKTIAPKSGAFSSAAKTLSAEASNITGFSSLKGFKGASVLGKAGKVAGMPIKSVLSIGKNLAKGAKALGPIGIGLSALAEVPDLVSAATSGKPGAFKNQLGKSVGGIGGSMVGAGIGATIGTAIAPGIGTALGTALGAIIGDMVGRIIGPAFMDGLGLFTKNIGKDFAGMWDGLKAAFRGFGNIIGPIARLIGRLMVPQFKILGAVIGGAVKAITWFLNVLLKVIGGVLDMIGNVVTSIESTFKNAWNNMKGSDNPFVKLIVKGLKGLFGTSADEDNVDNTVGNAANAAGGSGGSSGSSQQSNTTFSNLVAEEREKMRKEGTDKILKDPDKFATLNAIQRLERHTTNGIANTVDMHDLGLYGNVAATNSRPFIPVNHALRMKMLDDKFKEWGIAVDYTSNMGAHDNNKTSGHYIGNKVDVVTKDKYGRVAQLSKEQEDWLRANGYIGNGAVGWHNAGTGYHYDLRVAPGTGTRVSGATGVSSDTSTYNEVHQQTDDGVRDALLTFAAANKKDRENQRTRNLIFQATDVTGSLGCWGITQINNIGGPMRH